MSKYVETNTYMRCRKCENDIIECDFCSLEFIPCETIYCLDNGHSYNHLCKVCYQQEIEDNKIDLS